MTKLIIAIFGGTGAVGSTLAMRLIAKGHTLLIGSRHPTTEKTLGVVAKISAAAAHGGTCRAIKDSDVKEGQVILFSPPSDSVTSLASINEIAKSLGDLSGKVVIDLTNPLKFGASGLELTTTGNSGDFHSVGEALEKALPSAHLAKAFNTIGFAHMANPAPGGKPLQMLFAASAGAKALAHRVIEDVGFKPEYVGGMRFSRNLESICELWVQMAYFEKSRAGGNFAFGITDTPAG